LKKGFQIVDIAKCRRGNQLVDDCLDDSLLCTFSSGIVIALGFTVTGICERLLSIQMLISLFQADQIILFKASVFILLTEIKFHIHVNTADRINDFNHGIEADTGIVVNRNTEELGYGIHTRIDSINTGMRQLVIGIAQCRIGYQRISWYGNHIDMICDRIDNQQQIGVGTCLLIRRTGTVQTAQVNSKGLLGNVLLFLGLNGIGFGIGFQNLYIFLKILDVCFRHIVEGFRDRHCGHISLLHLIVECRIIHFLFGSIGADVLGN